MSLAAHTDDQLRTLAAAGDGAAQQELIRRGLAPDPDMLALAERTAAYYRTLLETLV